MVNLQQPLVYAVGILYVLVILGGLWTTWQAYPIVAAVVATTLLIVDAIVGWSPDAPRFIFVNRPLIGGTRSRDVTSGMEQRVHADVPVHALAPAVQPGPVAN